MSKEEDFNVWRDAFGYSDMDFDGDVDYQDAELEDEIHDSFNNTNPNNNKNLNCYSIGDSGYKIHRPNHHRQNSERIKKITQSKEDKRLVKAGKIAIILVIIFGVILIMNTIIYCCIDELPEAALLMLIFPLVYMIYSFIAFIIVIMKKQRIKTLNDPANKAMFEYYKQNKN